MPIYEYKCQNCGEKFEEFQSVGSGNEDVACPNCGTPRPERLFSAFSSSGTSERAAGSSGSCGPVGSPFS
ncbi:zinc ribbon domain-containing protein [candidate division KSB1 bacterium]|nr:zinc ribbon domain-containing protein [candidate division KSB1 bacterium]